MAGQDLGYIRVSSLSQNSDRQLIERRLDKKFVEKASGRDPDRPILKELIEYAREGDTVWVHSMDRLARNLDDLKSIVNTLTHKGVSISFQKENLIFRNDNSPMGDLMLSIVGAFAEFECSLIKERQREGIALAKKKGLYRGRKRSLSDDQIEMVRQRVKAGEKKAVIAREAGISRETLYQYLRNSTFASSSSAAQGHAL